MKRILVAVDPSDDSTFVLERAVELAMPQASKIRLLAAVQLPPIVPAPPMAPIYLDPSATTAPAEAALRAREHLVAPALRDGIVVELGPAADVICAVARAYAADLVVIGATRYGLFARILGTTAAKVVNNIDRSVIVIRPTPSERASSSPEGTT